ncbi:MAG TPA: cellulase family glycosylhydrolase [Miltoncostaeaceae bacterium]|nr:cellulase family glycosylhydrolase [Miltoncostaeaceae bacterium]
MSALVAAASLSVLAGMHTPHAVAAVFGVQDDHLTDAAPIRAVPARVKMVRATRARIARFDLLWSEVAPRRPRKPGDHHDPAYDWRRADAVIDALHHANITPIISVYSTPAWAVAGRRAAHDTVHNPNAPRAADLAAFMGAVAARYRGRARHLEIWNEPNLKSFFRLNGRSNPAHYKRLVRAAYPRIKRANRRAVVIAGVTGPRSSSGDGSIGARAWMYALTRDRRVPFDAYSQHIYPSQGPLYRSRAYARAFPTWQSLPEIHRALNARRRGMRLYVTEAGYTTATTPYRTVRVTPAKQRQYLDQIARLPAVRSHQTAAVIWFNLQDNPAWPAGLLTASGRAKPIYRSFRRIAARPVARPLRGELNRRLR